jgi:hypothetical protein
MGSCIRVKCGDGYAYMLLGGSEYLISINGEAVRFEDHPQCGPVPLGKRGQELKLGPRHKFWKAVTGWSQQGRRVENGWAVVDPPKRVKMYRVGRHLFPLSDSTLHDIATKLGIEPEIVCIDEYE